MAENLQLVGMRLRPSTVATYERLAKAIDAKPSQTMRGILEAAEPHILRAAIRIERARATGRVTPLSLGAVMAGIISDLGSVRRGLRSEEVQDAS
jgi:hypothetical protein